MAQKRKQKKAVALAPIQRTRLAEIPTFVLDGTDAQGLFEREVRAVEVTGLLREGRTAPICNIIETVLRSFTAESVDFTRCDFKDDVIRSSHFSKCVFTSASFLFSAVFQSVFEDCSFHDTVVQDCEFDGVAFSDCDLSHILVKACTFSRCEFRGCKTSNKVFEMCRLTDCVFQDTELQIDTLAENFGLTAASYHGTLRDARGDYTHRKLAIQELSDWLKTASARPLHKFNVDYFLKGTLLDGSPYLDASLDLASWAPMFRTAGSFVLALNQWVAFTLWLYEHDAAMIHTVLCLHSMTGELLNKFGTNPSNHQAISGVSGAHLSLARVVDEYLISLEHCTNSVRSEVVFLVEGKETETYYYRALSPLFARTKARIARLVPHNSPWDLAIRFAPHTNVLLFMALFLATRTRIELSRVTQIIRTRSALPSSRRRERGSNKEKEPSEQIVPHAQPILTLEFGGNLPIGNNPSLRLKAYLPGNLLAELRLNIKSQRVAKLRRVLKEVLSGS
jgi:uncharacterized protein YjbI with pentapeptide repeats